ncbi:cytochrome c-type biogenesis protein [Caenispirillum bisanense]|uniref:cytochrome c-type biogenesis protein n=1 Tax=Caenispirillum bisanense TaxID=414052 RepID=UPI0031DC2798
MSLSRCRSLLVAAGLALSLGLALPAAAVQPDEMLADPVLENRARDISKQLRCVVCQNENIDESNAELARDMRLLVRDRLVQGDSDGAILDYMVDRYGDYVLLEPPFKASTYALWFGPVIFVLLAALAGWAFYRNRAAAGPVAAAAGPAAGAGKPAELTAEERQRLEALLRDADRG